ncbi:unnamed protein product [Thlaspi arvense]|uniref:DUF630 domain-containing protein n=1 Tax=Thlaspi arvense TaxID=13288 RepID=A0AAU9RES0_THLAR|nr:unnamed protein product [Thlaspi arvense]
MGCTASKLDSEDTVRRCKERRRFMKDAVYARHHLAAAHSDYCRSLRLTGSALSSFASGESLVVSENTPAVFLRPSNDDAPRVPSRKPHPHDLPRRRKPSHPQPRLPHILSESSPSCSPVSERSNLTSRSFYPTAQQYSRSPSQASSAWNWENFYPPSPPDSEFFERKARHKQPPPSHAETDREEVHCSEWGDDHDRFTATTSSDGDGDRETNASRSGLESHAPAEPVNQHHEHGIANADEATTCSGMVVRHKDLKEILDAVQHYFDKAASAGDQVSAMLEMGRAELDRSFGKLRSRSTSPVL